MLHEWTGHSVTERSNVSDAAASDFFSLASTAWNNLFQLNYTTICKLQFDSIVIRCHFACVFKEWVYLVLCKQTSLIDRDQLIA